MATIFLVQMKLSRYCLQITLSEHYNVLDMHLYLEIKKFLYGGIAIAYALLHCAS